MACKLYVAVKIKIFKTWVLTDVTITEERKGTQNEEDEKLKSTVHVQG